MITEKFRFYFSNVFAFFLCMYAFEFLHQGWRHVLLTKEISVVPGKVSNRTAIYCRMKK